MIRRRDEQIARAFDEPRRSEMVIQLANMCELKLLAPEEVERFTAETQARIDFIAKERAR